MADGLPEGLVEIGRYPDERAAFEHCLVLVATGHESWLVPAEEGQRLLVEASAETSAKWQIACYEKESVSWPPKPAPLPPMPRLEYGTPVLWAMTTVLAYRLQTEAGSRLQELGALDSKAIFEHGECWRLLTALFLHADLGHLGANLCAGFFVFALVLPSFGRRRGWLLLLLSSMSANLAAVAINHSQNYRSLGASTAVFAGLGLLAGAAMRTALAHAQDRRWRTVMLPLAASLGLLALFGSGGLQTDLTAHLMGLSAGILWGGIAGTKNADR